MAIEDRLQKRIPSIEKAARIDSDGNQPSPFEIARAIATEANALSHGHGAKHPSTRTENDGALALRDDAINEALHSKEFRDCEDNCAHMDISTTEGCRSILEQGFLANCAIITKIIMRGSKELARRHTLLATMLEARGGSGISGIIDYFSHAHAMDHLTGEIPQSEDAVSFQ